MTIPNWQIKNPINTIIFDCDGTLSTIEGIDELAKKSGAADIVQRLTADAMGKLGINAGLYEQRLDLVQPTQEDLMDLGREYFAKRVDAAASVIQLLIHLGKSVYILSAGLLPAVVDFGRRLHVPEKNIFAVDIQFDSEGRYRSFDRSSPLVKSNGKREIVAQIKEKHPDILYVGDGLNDYAVYDLVQRFVGFGGAYYRENIAKLCAYYIKCPSLAPLIPLALTEDEKIGLTTQELALYHEGVDAIQAGQVIVQ